MHLILLKRIAVYVGIGMLAWSGGSGADTSFQKAPDVAVHRAFHWKDVNGHSYTQALFAHHKATVFFFVSSQCPIANLYTPRLLALARDYSPRGVTFFLVDSNTEDSLAAVRRYAKERAFSFPAIKDEGTALADTLAADKTPEAIILDSTGTVRYRGRIDDNTDPEKIIHHDVHEALDALLAGRSVPHPRTLSFGCIIFRDKPAPRLASPAAVTYARDVAPILNANCVTCHRRGETAPFSLETYQAARTWAAQIKDYTARRLMPPWKAVPGYGDFCDAHFLTAKQITTLARWSDTGAPLGDPKDVPASPQFPSPNGWKLGTPDLVLSPPRPYHLAADGKDVYREYVLPVSYDEARYLRGVEFKPDNRAVVHHIILFFDPSGESAKLEGHDSEPGYTVPGDWINPPGTAWGSQVIWVAGWAPGNTPSLLPEGTAFEIPAHANLVLQVHYHKDGKPEEDRSQVALYFAGKGKVDKVDKVMHVGAAINGTFDLKPGVAHQEVRASFTVPKGFDMHVWAAFPHMHNLGRQMKLWATLPNGTTKPMIWIQDWDFNWQESYRYKTPLALPGGTRVDLLAIYDNSERNPRQPSHPPKEVRWGEQTTDEMCIGFFQFTLDKQHLAHPLPPP